MDLQNIVLPSNKSFGIFLVIVLCGLSAYFAIFSSLHFAGLSFFVTVLTLVVTLVKPNLLKPFNRLWMTIGLYMGVVSNLIVLGGLFFVVITPLALLMRVFGRDELRIRSGRQSSYWEKRPPKSDTSFHQQF